MKSNELASLLKTAYAAELETVQNYLANAAWLDGLRAHEVAESLAADVPEELGHAQQLARRLKQLGLCPPGSQSLIRNQEKLQPTADSTDVRHVVEGALAAEQAAINLYRRIITAADGTDPVTQDLAVRILADEEAHHTLFAGFRKSLDRTPAG